MSRVGLIADIHANAVALEAVLRSLDSERVSAILCAGDIVGYNAAPRETLALVRQRGIESVHGNHDLMVTGRLPVDRCGPRGRRAVHWTRTVLSPEEYAQLDALPAMLRPDDHTVCVHATPGDAEMRLTAAHDFRLQAAKLSIDEPHVRMYLSGHTHTPHATRVSPEGHVDTHREGAVALDGDGIWFINPGSVGEPRDADRRASFAVLDFDTRNVTFHRVAYDTRRVAQDNLTRMPPLDEPARDEPARDQPLRDQPLRDQPPLERVPVARWVRTVARRLTRRPRERT